ncbi:MurR/RpiR family transcriptional regulator [Microbacterium capsulatum]|uniref:MurR/RpiR family transcriptional regulator n=1 Tax=Microbacterium capsulatum TaxID=3041921 RepID=A0ABU0XI55_9MICO|nr:MurR/RpiR family transcriptional regulator [Microbacterium sp. ASV81]MDQ4214354.1 MurR/RpiR family transcriptional regulator [Microbacterium sp. ASV81]
MTSTETPGALARLRAALLSLSATERRVADWILDRPERVLEASMLDVAQACDVSDTTVLRMCRNSGFAGFTDLKLALARDLASPMQLIHDDIADGDDPMTIANKVFARAVLSLQDTAHVIDPAGFAAALDLLDAAGSVLVGGVGTSGVVGQSFYQRCRRLGIGCDAPTDSQVQNIHAALLSPGDLVVAISYSGETRAVVAMAKRARDAGAKILAVTGNRESHLAKVADVTLQSVSHETRNEPIAARLCQLTLLDALCVAYSHRHLDDALGLEQRAGQAIVESSF